jgi:hypothetical protein
MTFAQPERLVERPNRDAGIHGPAVRFFIDAALSSRPASFPEGGSGGRKRSTAGPVNHPAPYS